MLAEILNERGVSSRGRQIPRGVKRKMSNFPLRRGHALGADPINYAKCVKVLKGTVLQPGLRPPEKVLIRQPQTRGRWIWWLSDALCGVQLRESLVWTCFPLAEAFFSRNSSWLATSEPVWSVSECCGSLGVQPSPGGFW